MRRHCQSARICPADLSPVQLCAYLEPGRSYLLYTTYQPPSSRHVAFVERLVIICLVVLAPASFEVLMCKELQTVYIDFGFRLMSGVYISQATLLRVLHG